MWEKLLESHKIRSSKILIDNFNNNYSIIFELQKLRVMKIRNHSQKNEKWQIISNMMATAFQHIQGEERAWWLQYKWYMMYISVSYQLSRIISINHTSTWNILTYFTQGSQIQGHIFYIIYFILYSILYVHNLHLGEWNWSTDALWCKTGTKSNMERWQGLGI